MSAPLRLVSPENPSVQPSVEPREKLRLLSEVEKKVLWLSSWMIHNANHLRSSLDGLKVGGHQSSCASSVTLLTALYMDVLRPQDRVAVKPHASPVFHALQYLLGKQSRDNLEAFRALGGAQAYPSRTKDADDVDFSTGSVGLGVAVTAVRLAGPGLRAPARHGSATACGDGPHGRADGRRRTGRGQHLRGPARRLEARRPQPVVGDRLQPPEPRRRRQRPLVPEDRSPFSTRSAGTS